MDRPDPAHRVPRPTRRCHPERAEFPVASSVSVVSDLQLPFVQKAASIQPCRFRNSDYAESNLGRHTYPLTPHDGPEVLRATNPARAADFSSPEPSCWRWWEERPSIEKQTIELSFFTPKNMSPKKAHFG